MPWAKLIRFGKTKHLWALVVFVAIFLAVRVPGLSSDAINPDGVNWHYRSEQFVVGLKTGDFAKTYQHYHPGVTLMWVVGSIVEVIKQLNPADAVYTHENFTTFHFYSKLGLIFVQLVLTLVLLNLLTKVFGFTKALLAVILVSLEPFFLGNSRLLHMDVLLALFLANGLLFAYFAAKKFSWANAICAGTFLALAFLTKSIAVGAILFALGAGTFFVWRQSRQLVSVLRYFGVVFISFLIVMVLLFPALWVDFFGTLINIFDEAERIGVRKGHGQYIFGEYTRDAGILFYPLVLLMKVSPVTLIGIFLFGFFALRSFKLNWQSVLSFLGVFYAGYFLVMIFPSKKLDRYMVPMFPFMCLLAVLGYSKVVEAFPQYKKLVVALLGALIVYPLLAFFPYYFTYTSPVFGTASAAHKVIAQKPFGIGVYELKNRIFEKYGPYPRLGFFDVKPMRAIYMNSRIFDIRVNGISDYDLIILGPNEEMPENVLDSSTQFILSDTVFINGLEYWRIYEKTH